MRLFDVYMAVDWSARNRPSPTKPSVDAIWVGERLANPLRDLTTVAESYWPTRRRAEQHIRTRLLHHRHMLHRVFLGFDFAYGYPAGFTDALGLQGDMPAWRRVWDVLSRLVSDDDQNANNRFAVAAGLNMRCGGPGLGPFWGCPAGMRVPGLLPTSPVYPYPAASGRSLERWRCVDRRASGIQPVWKLYGAGSVGGQSLVGIPVVCRLRDDPALTPVSLVWPFETGFGTRAIPGAGPLILHAEIWPSISPIPLDARVAIRDQAQVRSVVTWLSELDERGELGALFEIPPGLAGAAVASCVGEEGWILGGR